MTSVTHCLILFALFHEEFMSFHIYPFSYLFLCVCLWRTLQIPTHPPTFKCVLEIRDPSSENFVFLHECVFTKLFVCCFYFNDVYIRKMCWKGPLWWWVQCVYWSQKVKHFEEVRSIKHFRFSSVNIFRKVIRNCQSSDFVNIWQQILWVFFVHLLAGCLHAWQRARWLQADVVSSNCMLKCTSVFAIWRHQFGDSLNFIVSLVHDASK